MRIDGARRDAALVGAFFGFVSGVAALLLVLVVTWLRGPSSTLPPGTTTLALHLGSVPVYLMSGALLGYLWRWRARAAGRWLLWFIGCATGALTVNSLAHGPWWSWAPGAWGYYVLVAIGFTPVFAWPDRPRHTAP